MPVIFLFIDGIGMGKESAANPFLQQTFPGFSAMAGDQAFSENAEEISINGHVFRHIDARLGVEGLPQSGTGQTTLFTGENASKKIGKHFGPFPHSGIKPLLKNKSIFKKAQRLDRSCQFMNAYPDIFFKKAEKRNRWSCTTLMTKSAGIRLNTTEDVKNGKALTAEITQQAWREYLDIDVPEITPGEAAGRLLEQTENYDLLLYEYYLTDKAGHSQKMEKATEFLKTYDRFLWHLIRHKPKELTLVLSSDHGNVEDLSTNTHTLNPVPLFVYGPGAHYFSKAESIMEVTPGVLEIFKNSD